MVLFLFGWSGENPIKIISHINGYENIINNYVGISIQLGKERLLNR